MKKIKLLTPILGLTTIAAGLAPLASCSCNLDESEKVVPEDSFEIKDVTLKGFKEDFEYKNYTKLVLPSNVKVVDYDAFKGLLKNNCKIKTVVIPGNIETIRKGAFENCDNVSVYDFSQLTVDQIYALKVEEYAFGDAEADGIYSYIQMNDNWTDVEKNALKQKLLAAHLPSYCLTEQTSGNVEVENSMTQTGLGGIGLHELSLSKQYDVSYNYTATVSRLDGTEGVTAKIHSIEKDQSNKTLNVKTKMSTYDDHVLKDGDWVTYKLVLACTYEDDQTNTTKIKWLQTIEIFKLTFETAHVKSMTIDPSSYTFDDEGQEKQLNVVFTPTEPTKTDVTWSSSDESVVTVSSTGKATSVAAGTAVITATSVDNPEAKATCNIKVNASYPVPAPVGPDTDYVAFKSLPEKIVEGTTLSTLYDINRAGYKIDPDYTDIRIGGESGTSIKNEAGVEFRAGRLTIPGNLITGSVYIYIQLVEIDHELVEPVLGMNPNKIVEWCNDYEAGNITRDQFVSKFTIQLSSGAEVALTSDLELIGSKLQVSINNKEHLCRILDIDHDTITETGKKAALTFELETLLSDENGNAFISLMGSSIDELKNHRSYEDSILRYNLTGKGTPLAQQGELWNKTAFDMFEEDSFKNAIKEVDKQVSTYDSSTQSFVVKDKSYSDKLFPFTQYELNPQDSSYPIVEEGTPYKYYSSRRTVGYRIKNDYAGNAKPYWLVSPYYKDTNKVWLGVNNGGYVNHQGPGTYLAVTFGFCI